MQIDMFSSEKLAGIAQTATGGDRAPKGKFQAPRFMPVKVTARKVGDKLVPVVAITQADRDKAASMSAAVYRGGKVYRGKRVDFDTSGGELTKKRGGAVGMFEGWREVINEPVRQRVGLAGMAASYRQD